MAIFAIRCRSTPTFLFFLTSLFAFCCLCYAGAKPSDVAIIKECILDSILKNYKNME